MNSTFKVGLMTLIASALLIYMVFIIGDFSLSARGYRLTISFYSVNGLTQGSSVSMAGVKIGKVERIEIHDAQVLVHAFIRDENIKIRRRSIFTIGTAGLMGEKFVEIMPTRDYTSPYVFPGATVEGTDPMRMEELFEQGNMLLKKLQDLTVSAKDIIGDPELKHSAKMIFKNAESASEKLNEIIASVQKRTDNIVENLDSILAKFDDEIDRNRDDIRKMVENLKDFSSRLSEISSDNRENIKDIVSNIRGVSEKLDKMVEELNSDNEMTDNLKNTISSLKDASKNAKEIVEEVKEIVIDRDIRKKIKTGLDDAHKLAQAVDKVFLNIKQTRIDFKYLLRYNKDTEKFFSDMMVDVYPSETSYYRIGVEDIGGDPAFNLMLARDAQTRFVKRGGVISSKVGLGVDYLWAKDMVYSLDFIDTRNPTARFTSSYMLKSGIQFQIRVDDITNDKDVNFAVEYKF